MEEAQGSACESEGKPRNRCVRDPTLVEFDKNATVREARKRAIFVTAEPAVHIDHGVLGDAEARLAMSLTWSERMSPSSSTEILLLASRRRKNRIYIVRPVAKLYCSPWISSA